MQIVTVLAVGLAMCARLRSSQVRSPGSWAVVALGLVIAMASPTAAVLVGVVALIGIEARSGVMGLFVFLAALLGIGAMIISAVAPTAALLVEAPAVLCVMAGAAVALGAEQRAVRT